MWSLWRRPRASSDELAILAKHVHGLGLRLQQLEESHQALQAAHERLRGRFYATKPTGSPDEPRSKADILREFGFVPGKPTPHQ